MAVTSAPIIVVDDDPDTVAMLVAFFELLDLPVVPCPAGPDAPACIRALQPQLLILDALLADGVSGVDVLEAVRQDPALRAVPVIFFSGDERQIRQRVPDDGMADVHVVEKPDVEQLIALVQRLVPAPLP